MVPPLDSPRFDTLSDWLAWQEKHHPSEIDLGLERVRMVAERLNLLRPSARVITIAGTNGKGSCVATLEALMSAAGKRYGAFTSPHLLRYNERIRLQSEPVDDAIICDAFARIDKARGEISLTYFEFGTLAAMVIFNDQELDYWLLEVGLGGRLDAVNIIDPSIAVITSIALDHQAWLGDTREKIGFEKAGICRTSAPLICSDPEPPASINERVVQLGSKALWINRDFSFSVTEASDSFSAPVTSFQTSIGIAFEVCGLGLPAPSVAAALEVMTQENLLKQGMNISRLHERLNLAGRFQVIHRCGRDVILDVAHNPAASQLLAKRLQQYYPGGVCVIIAMMADKDIAQSLEPLKPWVRHWYCAELTANPRAAKSGAVADLLISELGVDAHQVSSTRSMSDASVATMLAMCLESTSMTGANHNPLPVLVCGSFFTVAEALEYLHSV